MGLPTLYRLHRWIAVATGIALLGWLVTGLVITAGGFAPRSRDRPPKTVVDWNRATLPPDQVAARVGGTGAPLRALTLAEVGGQLLWAATPARGATAALPVWVSAIDGKPVEDPGALAAAAARRHPLGELRVVAVELVRSYDAGYDHGPLPAWRVRFGDPARTWTHVAVADGSVRSNRAVDRRKLAVEHLHTLESPELSDPRHRPAALAALWLLSTTTAVATLLGLVLLWPRRGVGGWSSSLRRVPSLDSRVLHRWLALPAAALVLTWVFSGLTMSWDRVDPPPRPIAPPLDLAGPLLSPAQAAAAARIGRSGAGAVRRLDLVSFGPRPLYRVELEGVPPVLVDPIDGAPVAVDEALALRAARAAFPEAHPVSRGRRILRNSPHYPYGPLPAWRFALGDRHGTELVVAETTGEVARSDRWSRLRTTIRTLHTFQFLKLIVRSERVVTAALWVAVLLALATGLLGYRLALPPRRRGRPQPGRNRAA